MKLEEDEMYSEDNLKRTTKQKSKKSVNKEYLQLQKSHITGKVPSSG